MKRLILLFLIGTCSYYSSTASHISGGQITYTCLGNNMYEVTLSLYRDCDGISMPSAHTVDFASPCGSLSQSLPLTNPGGTEVSQICAAHIPNSTCNGGTLPGVQVYHYTGIVALAPCDPWTMSWDVCCRNAAIQNLVGAGALEIYIEATMNNLNFPCNSSPSLAAPPIAYVCTNQPVSYSYSTIDPEGDLMSYSLISAMESGGTPTQYAPGYSATQPIPGTTLDPTTGHLTFTPTMIGNFVFVVQVQQFDAMGNLIGTIMRDMQFIVINCTNQQPDPTSGDITNFSGTATQLGPTSIEMCAGENFCFDIVITDPDTGDSLTVVSNVAQALPGATITTTGVNPVTATICYGGSGLSGTHTFVVTVTDDQCPIYGTQSFVYDLHIISATYTGADQRICGTQAAQLNAVGGSNFSWSVLSGDPIVVGQNFSCNPCSAPIATPAMTTTYLVTSNLAGTCSATDTITVEVVPAFTLVVTASDSVVCWQPQGVPIQFNASVTPFQPGYTYQWSPSIFLNDPAIADPIGTFTQVGIFDFTVVVTSPDGCVMDQIIQVVVDPCGSSAGCVGTACQCSGSSQDYDIGNGTLVGTASSYPSPFGHYFEGARHQMLYRASEIQATGLTVGNITKLAMEIAQINGTSTYYEFGIKMGCTTASDLADPQWIPGLSTVFYADTLPIQLGWQGFQFQIPYHWDGTSNVVVEVCFNNDGHLPGFTSNSPVVSTQTPFESVRYSRQDNNPLICSDTLSAMVSQQRPNLRMKWCNSLPTIDSLTFIPTCADTILTISTTTSGSVDHFIWNFPPNWTVVAGDSTSSITIATTSPGPFQLTVTPVNACGGGNTFTQDVQCVVGIEDLLLNGTTPTIVPVPAKQGELLLVTGLDPKATISIVGMDGRAWNTKAIHNGNQRIVDTQDLPAGTYVLRTEKIALRFVISGQ